MLWIWPWLLEAEGQAGDTRICKNDERKGVKYAESNKKCQGSIEGAGGAAGNRWGSVKMSEVKWIKITTDIFDDEKILLIESLPDSYAIITAWFKLLCLAGKQNNDGVFIMNDRVPYTEKMLATIFRMKETTVTLALDTFESFGMIERVNGTITIPNWGKHQTLDAYEKKKARDKRYQAERRARQKAIALKSSDASSDKSSDVAVSDKEEDKDIYNICSPEPDERETDFKKIYAIYPKKRGRTKAYTNYCSWLKGRTVNGKRRKLTNKEIYLAVYRYVEQKKAEGAELEFYKNFDTLMGNQLLDYVEDPKDE